jgi:hypothetical protein
LEVSGDTVVVATRLGDGWFRIRIPATAKNFSLLRKVQTGSGAHTASYSMGIAVLTRGKSGWVVTFYVEVKNE